MRHLRSWWSKRYDWEPFCCSERKTSRKQEKLVDMCEEYGRWFFSLQVSQSITLWYFIYGDTIWHSTYSGVIPQQLFWQGLERHGSCTWNESEQLSFLGEFSSREAAKVLGLESPHQLQLRRVRTDTEMWWYINIWYMINVSLKEDWDSWTWFHFEYLWTHIVQGNFWSRNSWNGCWHTIHLCACLETSSLLDLLC